MFLSTRCRPSWLTTRKIHISTKIGTPLGICKNGHEQEWTETFMDGHENCGQISATRTPYLGRSWSGDNAT